MIELGSCFKAVKCAICSREFKEGEAKYEVDGIGCVCWECKEKLDEVGDQ